MSFQFFVSVYEDFNISGNFPLNFWGAMPLLNYSAHARRLVPSRVYTYDHLHNRDRNLKISSAIKRAESRGPAYSQALSPNIIVKTIGLGLGLKRQGR